MIKVLSAQQMQRCDAAAIEEYSIPGALLMENAGVHVLDSIAEHFDGDLPASVAVLCGKGNNGGDGLVVARHLHNLGSDVVVYLFAGADELRGDAALNLRIAAGMGVHIVEAQASEPGGDSSRLPDLSGHDCIVDALLGTGATGPARGAIAEAIHGIGSSADCGSGSINAAHAAGVLVISVDLPSGLLADSGHLPGPVVDADVTVTFAAPKVCHVVSPAADQCGEVVVVDIGIPRQLLEAAPAILRLMTPADAAALATNLIASRASVGHKGDYGRVLIVAGSVGMAGAAVLAGRAALRTGAGLVTVACDEQVHAAVASQLVEALVVPLAVAAAFTARSDSSGSRGARARGSAGEITPEASVAASDQHPAFDQLLQLAARADVVAVGPGLGSSPDVGALVCALIEHVAKPVVLDADALNIFAGSLHRICDLRHSRQPSAPLLLTPHPGELGRLLGVSAAEIQADRVGAVRRAAELSAAIVLLKGSGTLVATPEAEAEAAESPTLNPTGNPGMATGGSGDVLTGMLAAMIVQGIEPADAARAGAFLHGRCGDLAAARVGETALVAQDLIDELPNALAWLREQAS